MTDRKPAKQYLEDYTAGQVFRSASLRIDKDEIIAFAGQFPSATLPPRRRGRAQTVSEDWRASGWHTAALTMRLLVDGEFKPAHGILGVGVDELRWPRPVRPGDDLYAETEVLEVRPSKSQPDRGLIRVRTTTFNQRGEQVQVYIGNLLVPRRPAAAS